MYIYFVHEFDAPNPSVQCFHFYVFCLSFYLLIYFSFTVLHWNFLGTSENAAWKTL